MSPGEEELECQPEGLAVTATGGGAGPPGGPFKVRWRTGDVPRMIDRDSCTRGVGQCLQMAAVKAQIVVVGVRTSTWWHPNFSDATCSSKVECMNAVTSVKTMCGFHTEIRRKQSKAKQSKAKQSNLKAKQTCSSTCPPQVPNRDISDRYPS